MAERRVSSVKCFGGELSPSMISACTPAHRCPSSIGGRDCMVSFSSGLFRSSFRQSDQIFFQPSCKIARPFARKEVPSQSRVHSVSFIHSGLLTAQNNRATTRMRIFLSPVGSAFKSVSAIDLVGKMAWWSLTLLLSITAERLFLSVISEIGKTPERLWSSAGKLLSISSVRKLLSVLG